MRRKGENAMKSTPTRFPQHTTPLPISRLIEGDTLAERMGQISAAIARRAYELFEARGSEDGHDWQDWFRAESELLAPVPVKVAETDQELHVRAEVPGFTDKDVEVRVEPRRLIICGKKQQTSEQEKGRAGSRVERSDEIVRVVDLPHEIDPDKVRATLENEMLTITLPKVNPRTKTPVGIKAA
jgi:HSP20 family protein